MTEPVVEHYRAAGSLAQVDGERPPDEVELEIRDVLYGLRESR